MYALFTLKETFNSSICKSGGVGYYNSKQKGLSKQCISKVSISDYCVTIWPASCEKGPSDICKKCRPRPAATSPTPCLVRVCTFLHSPHQRHISSCFQYRMVADLGLHYLLYVIGSGHSSVVERRALDLKVRGSTPALDEIFVRCFSVSPTHTESEKMCLLASHA